MKHLVFLVLISLSSCSGIQAKLPTLDPAMKIDFAAIDTDGNRPVTLSQSLGRFTLVHLWATWCPQCLMELEHMQHLREQIDSSDFKIIAVALSSDLIKIEEISKSTGLTFAVWNDEEGNSQNALNPPSLPFSVLVDQNGLPVSFLDPETKRLVTWTAGPRAWDLPQVVESFEQILKR